MAESNILENENDEPDTIPTHLAHNREDVFSFNDDSSDDYYSRFEFLDDDYDSQSDGGSIQIVSDSNNLKDHCSDLGQKSINLPPSSTTASCVPSVCSNDQVPTVSFY